MKIITKKQFKQLILLEVAIGVVAILCGVFGEQFLPTVLQEYLQAESNAPITTYEALVGLMVIVVGLWSLQNLVALYKFRKYARTHALVLTLLWPIIAVLMATTPVIYLQIEDVFYGINAILWGVTLALLYCSNIAEYFQSIPSHTDPGVTS